MVWATIKRNVEAKNLNFSLSDVIEFTKSEFLKITPDVFKKYEDHVKKVEEKFVESDRQLEEVINEYAQRGISGSDGNASTYSTDSESGASSDSCSISNSEVQFLEDSI